MANQAALRFRTSLRRGLRRGHKLVSAVLAPVAGVTAQLAPISVAAAVGAVGVTAASVALSNQPAHASITGSALILSTSVNGGTASLEYQQAQALGLNVTVDTPATWDAMTMAQFQAYTVIILGDPSTTTCATTVPADALSTNATWGAAINGNVSVLGTAPALAGSSAAALVSDAIAYAASSGSGKTGLYASLNCYYSTGAAGTDATLLDHVDGTSAFLVTGQSASCPAAAGTVNTWEALALTQFNGLTSPNLGPWASPACSVEETFNQWPAGLDGVGYLTGATPGTFTASDGATGQAYILAGAPVPGATAALASSVGGQVPAGTTAGGSNQAAPGVNQPTANGVNTATGDFSQSATDFSVPTFGPSLAFSRSYDSQTAQAQTKTGKPGPFGYGWTGNWMSSLNIAKPVLGAIYTIDGLRTGNGNGGPSTGGTLSSPGEMILSNGNVYIADTAGNRVQEIPGTTGTQWGQSMTAGDIYTITGSPTGVSGASGNGTAIGSARLKSPGSAAVDSSGNLYIADTGNNRVLEVPAVAGLNRGFGTMTVNDIYVIAGTGACGVGGDNVAATSSALCTPWGVATAPTGSDVYIADSGNNRIQEVAATSKTQWGQSMTANYVYTVAGSSAGTGGISSNGTVATSSLLSTPEGVTISAAGNMFIGDTANCRVAEVPPASGTQWGQSMTANDLYTVAGRGGPTNCTIGNDNKIATQSNLIDPVQVVVGPGTKADLYLADSGNNRIQEVSATSQTEWGQAMTATYIYTVAGSPNGTAGFSGDGGSSIAATMTGPVGVAVGSMIYTSDTGNNRSRVVSSAGVISELAGNGGTLAQTGNGGPAFMAALQSPQGEAFDTAGNMYVADTQNNRIQEIAAVSHTQYGINMTAGDVYTIAGSPVGASGSAGNGGAAIAAYLYQPMSIAMDASGNLFIADTKNCRIQEVSASGTMSTVAGFATPTCGLQASPYGDGILATSSMLSQIEGVEVDGFGDIYIADTANNRIQEVYAAGGQNWGQAMTAGYMYTMAGQANGTPGYTGGNGVATSAYLNLPVATGQDGTGNLYIADWGNNRIQEVAAVTARMRNRNMTYKNIYTIAGSVGGTPGVTGDGGYAPSAYLHGPGNATSDAAGNLYISDGSNNRIQELAVANGTQWGQSMAANYIYTVAGSATGASGSGGDGGPATAALMNIAENISLDPAGNMYITDGTNNSLREVTATTTTTIAPAPGQTSTFSPSPGGITISQADGSQVTFYSQNAGACAAPYVVAGSYCALPEDVGASLALSGGTYTFSPQPGSGYTYNAAGQFTSESDTAGDILSVAYGTVAPGTGNCPAAANWCQLITSASGRVLTIGYNASNLITSATDPMGRQWTYGYTGSDLTSATDPMGHVTSYAYDTANTSPLLASDMTTITKPNGQTGGPDAGAHTSIAYDTSGRVTSETDPMGYVSTYDWTGYNPSTGNGVITVSDPDGNKTVYYYTQGTLAAQSAWTGTTLTSEQDMVPDMTADGTTAAGTLLPTVSADGTGTITTRTFDTAGSWLTSTSPDGQTTPTGGLQLGTATQHSSPLRRPDCNADPVATQTCQQAPGPAPVTHGQVITPPSQVPPYGVSWTLYDNFGNDLYTTIGVYEPGSSTPAYAQTTYHLYNGNSVTLPGTSTAISCAATAPSPTLPCATVNAAGVVTQLGYDAQGDLTSTSAPDGNGSELATTTFAYDGDGEQTNTTSPDGNLPGANAGNYTTITAYNADGQVTSATEAGGTGHTVTSRVTSNGYDANGNQTTAQDARGFTTTTAFSADDQPVLVTNPDGNAALTCYDGDGNVAQTVPPAGVAAKSLTPSSCPTSYPAGYNPATSQLAPDAIMMMFNALGQQTQEYAPLPAGQTGPPSYETTSYSYDSDGRLVQVTAPAASNGGQSQVTTSTYDPAGNLATVTTGTGVTASTVSYCYDPSGRTTSVVYADGNTTGVAPCNTNPTTYPWIVDPKAYPTQGAAQTTYAYDSVGEAVSVTRPATASVPSGATWTSTYDPMGDVLTSTDPNNVTTTMTYTPSGAVASVSYSGNSAHSVATSYGANGEMTGRTDATGSSTYSYDPFGELTSATNGAGQVTGYGYNADAQITSITYPLPTGATWATTATVNRTYDNAGMLTGVTDFNGHQITIGHTADGLPNSTSLGTSGDTITTTYDNTNSTSAITLTNASSTVQSFNYTDSPAGTILNETDTPSSAQSPAVYTYDNRSRVTSMTPGTGTTLNYGFDASNSLTTLPTGATGSYDHAGELVTGTLSGVTTSYAYNASGQRLNSTQGTSTITSGTWNGAGQLTAYANATANMSAASYDAVGRRASATNLPTGGSLSTQNFIWDNNNLLMDSQNAYIYDGGIAPAEQVNLATGTISCLLADSLGSIRGIINTAGTLTATTSYDAWGNPQTTGGLTSYTPFGYAGGFTDPTGLIYLINRYYDPATGQFLSLDPQVDQTLQPYAYTTGNPVSQIDPAGLCSRTSTQSCRYLYARNFTYNKIKTWMTWRIFKEIQSSWNSWDPFKWDWAIRAFQKQVKSYGPWDIKNYLAHGSTDLNNVTAQPGEDTGYARFSANMQIYFNVWGNIAFGYIGMQEGFSSWLLDYGATHAGGAGLNTPGNAIERQIGYDLYWMYPNGLWGPQNLDNAIWWEAYSLTRYCDIRHFPHPDDRKGCRQ